MEARMTPADQLVLHDPDDPQKMGDCLRACIASVLGLEPTDVPHFVQQGHDAGDTEDDGLAWYELLRYFLRERNLDVLWCPANELGDYLPWSVIDVCLLAGPSPRGPFDHVVVGLPDGTVLHDPHPSRDGIEGVTSVVLFASAEVFAENVA